MDRSPMTTAGVVTPITPTSQADCYATSEGQSYTLEFPRSYDNQQLSATQNYADSGESVNLSDFFTQNYHPS